MLDRLEGAEPGQAEIFFHFAADIQINPGPAEHCWTATRAGSERELVLHTDPGWHFECFRGSIDPISGWYSPALEEKLPATTLRGQAASAAACSCLTRLVPGGQKPEEQLQT